MEGDESTDGGGNPTSGRGDERPEPESSSDRRGFLRTLVAKVLALTTAGSILLSEDAGFPGETRSPDERDRVPPSDDDRQAERVEETGGVGDDGIDSSEERIEDLDEGGSGDLSELHDRLPTVHVPFDASDFEREFTGRGVTDYNRIVDAPAGASWSLRVAIPSGNHYGTSLHYEFEKAGMAEPTALHSTYYLYVPSTFEFEGHASGKLPGPAGTYGRAGWGGRPSDGTNGWSARMAFGDSASSDTIRLSSYVYHAEMTGTTGSNFWWDAGDASSVDFGKWYRIDNYVQLNTPGENDGVLRGWIDGELALDETDLRFRDVERLKIEEYWFDVYYGGNAPSPVDNAIHFRDLRLWAFDRT